MIAIRLESRIYTNYCYTNIIRDYFVVKVGNFIAMRFYFGFQKKKNIIDRLVIKFLFDVTTDFILNSIIFFS